MKLNYKMKQQIYSARTLPDRFNKPSWFVTHGKELKLSVQPSPIIFNITVRLNCCRLSRYSTIWKKYFQDHNWFNCRISDDHTKYALRQANGIFVPLSMIYIGSLLNK